MFYAVNGVGRPIGRLGLVDAAMFIGQESHPVDRGVSGLASVVRLASRPSGHGSALGVSVGVGDFVGTPNSSLWIARPRPCQALQNVHELTGCGGLFSMPSNHAVNAATAAAFLGVLFPKTRWPMGVPLLAVLGGTLPRLPWGPITQRTYSQAGASAVSWVWRSAI